MRLATWIGLLGLAALVATAHAADQDKKGTVVELDGLKSTTPAEWVSEEPSNTLRYMQFKLPKLKDDKYDAELVIFRGITTGVDDGVKRWKDDFKPPEGKKIDDVSKVSKIKIGDVEATHVDVSGTYLFKKRPRDPSEKPDPRADHRLLGVLFFGKEKYQIRLVGPKATVDNYEKGFNEWLKNFK